MRPLRVVFTIVLTITLQHAITRNSHATTISLALEDPYTAAKFAPGAQHDFWQAVRTNSNIESLLPHLAAVSIGSDFFKYASDAEIRSLIDWTKTNNLPLELGTGVLPVTGPTGCGWGVEGYDGMFQNHLQRIRDLGGSVSVLNLDEPLYFGSEWRGANSCNSSIAQIALETISSIDVAKSIFPDIYIVDTEPVPIVSQYRTWLTSLNADQPGSINGFSADIIWTADWQTALRGVYQSARQFGIRPGAIIDGNYGSQTACSWASSATSNFNTLKINGLLPPDITVQSWQSEPGNIGPPDAPCSLASVASYAISQTTAPVPEPPQFLILLTMGAMLPAIQYYRRRRRGGSRRSAVDPAHYIL